MATRKVYTLLGNTGTVGKANAMQHGNDSLPRIIQATLVGDGAIAAEVAIDGSLNDNPPAWCQVGTISISGTDAVSSFIVSSAPWPYTQATLTSISGTNSAISVNISA